MSPVKRFRKYVWPLRSWIVAVALLLALVGAFSSYQNTNDTAVEAKRTAQQLRVTAVEAHEAAIRARRTARRVHRSLCALRAERVANVKQQTGSLNRAKDFLRKHPEGAGDISRADIQASIDSIRAQIKLQRQTIRAFRFIRCR